MAYEELLYAGIMMGSVFGICIPLLWGIVKKKMWPIRIMLAQQRGDSVLWDLDERAKLSRRKDGYEFLRLMGRKINIKPPKFAHVTMEKGGKPAYPLFSTTTGQYLPVKMMSPPRLEVIEDASAKNWGVLERERVRKNYSPRESFFMKYAPFIMSATFAAMIIFFVIYFAGKMEAVSSSLAGAASTLTSAIQTFTNAPKPPGSVVVNPPVVS